MNVARIRQAARRRPYQIAVVSAALMVVGSTGGVLLAQADGASADAARTAVLQAAPAGAVLAPPAATPSSAASTPGASASAGGPAKAAQPEASKPTAPKPPAQKVLGYQYQLQITYYYCAPAATRIALTARGIQPSQDDLAAQLNTTEAGTDSAEDTTRVLNALIGGDTYQTRPMDVVNPARMDQLQADVVRAVTGGRAVVANIAGSATDTDGRWYSFPGGHYLTVVGYRDDGRTVKIADPANASAASYWMTTIDLANWMAGHGYSA